MNSPLTILGICGSLRKQSFNRMTLLAAQKLAPQGTRVEICEIRDLPLFNQDEEQNPPSAIVEFKRSIRAADAILFATPEYNYGIPGVLKNAIDCASRPYGDSAWDGKPAAIMSASGSVLGGVRAHYQLRQSFVFLNMYPVNLPEVMIASAQDKFDSQGNLKDENSQKLIRQLLEKLATWSRRLAEREAIAA